MSTIFLSHASSDNAKALALTVWLESEGWSNYFLDLSTERGLAPGERWQEALRGAVDRCEAIVILLSPAWLNSRWCLEEFHLARQFGKTIFGVVVEPVETQFIPVELTQTWQLCDLVSGTELRAFTVAADGILLPTRVELTQAGLTRLAIGLRKAGLDPSTFPWPPPGDENRAPYRGLQALDTEDAAILFGRDSAITRGMDSLREMRDRRIDRLFVILGASGAGKSSYLRAGLWPRLKRDDPHFLPLRPIRPGRAVLTGPDGLVASLLQALDERGIHLPRSLILSRLTGPGGLRSLLADLMAADHLARPERSGTRGRTPTLVIPIDQGEELLGAEGSEETGILFERMSEVLSECPAVSSSSPQDEAMPVDVIAVLTIRTDGYDRLQQTRTLAEVRTRLFDLKPLTFSELKEVIEGPAIRATAAGHRLVIDPALTEALLADAKGADVTPLLAFTLERLFLGRGEENSLRFDQYQRLGGIRSSIEAAIATALAFSESGSSNPTDMPRRSALMRAGFVPWLARIDIESGAITRRVARWDEIPVLSQPLMEQLVSARLLRRDWRIGDDGTSTEIVEVAHESLFVEWTDLAGWLSEERDALHVAHTVIRAATDWDRNSRTPEWLLHDGARLHSAELVSQRTEYANLIAVLGVLYLNQCRTRTREREEANRRQKQRFVKLALSAASTTFLLALFATVMWWRTAAATRQSESNAYEARISLSQSLFGEGLRWAERGDLGQAITSIADSLETNPESVAGRAALFGLLTRFPLNIPMFSFRHESEVHAVAFSRNSESIVTASDRSVRVWNTRSGLSVGRPMTPTARILSATFDPERDHVLTSTAEGLVQLWDIPSGEIIDPWPSLVQDGPASASFSQNGQNMLIGNATTTEVRNADSGELVAPAFQHGGRVSSATFSPSGRYVLTVSLEELVARKWAVGSGAPVTTYRFPHDLQIDSAELTPNEQFLVIHGTGGSVGVLRADSGAPIYVVNNDDPQDSIAPGFAISPSGQYLAVDQGRKKVRVLNIESETARGPTMEQREKIVTLTFAGSDDRLLTQSRVSAQLWDVESGRMVGQPMRNVTHLTTVAVDPRGDFAVTASRDGTARVWRLASSTQIAQPIEFPVPVLTAIFHPSGSHIVSAVENSTGALPSEAAVIWDAETGSLVGPPLNHDAPVNTARFSPNGRLIVTSSMDSTVRIWNAETGAPTGVTIRHGDFANSADFSPRGNLVVSVWDNSRVVVSRTATGTPLGEPMVRARGIGSLASISANEELAMTPGCVWDIRSNRILWENDQSYVAAFSPDGLTIASAVGNTVQIVESQTGIPIGNTMQHGDYVNSVEFSPNGKFLLAIDVLHTAQLWDTASGLAITPPLRDNPGIRLAAFSPDSRLVVTTGATTAQLWDTETGAPVGPPMTYELGVHSASFSGDGRFVAFISGYTAYVWEISCPPSATTGLVTLARVIAGGSRRAAESADSPTAPHDTLTSFALAPTTGSEEDVPAASKLAAWLLKDAAVRTPSPSLPADRDSAFQTDLPL